MPGLSVSGLTIGVKDAFRGNHYSVSGNVDVNIGNGLVIGHWANLAMDPGGSLTGQVSLHFGIPRLDAARPQPQHLARLAHRRDDGGRADLARSRRRARRR